MEPIIRLVIVNFKYSRELENECPSQYSTLRFYAGIPLTITNSENPNNSSISQKFCLCLQRVRKLTARTTNCRLLTDYCLLNASSSDGSGRCKETACSLVIFKKLRSTAEQNTQAKHSTQCEEEENGIASGSRAIDPNCVSLPTIRSKLEEFGQTGVPLQLLFALCSILNCQGLPGGLCRSTSFSNQLRPLARLQQCSPVLDRITTQ